MSDDRYPALGTDPRALRSRRANRTAALVLLAAIVLAIVLIAIFG